MYTAIRSLGWTVFFADTKGTRGSPLERGTAPTEGDPSHCIFDRLPSPRRKQAKVAYVRAEGHTVLCGTSANFELIRLNQAKIEEVKRGSPEDSWDRASFISKPHTFLNHRSHVAQSSNAWTFKATLFFQEHNTAFGLSATTECALRGWGWWGGRQSLRHGAPSSVPGLFRA